MTVDSGEMSLWLPVPKGNECVYGVRLCSFQRIVFMRVYVSMRVFVCEYVNVKKYFVSILGLGLSV